MADGITDQSLQITEEPIQNPVYETISALISKR
jgi:hypothetical protein